MPEIYEISVSGSSLQFTKSDASLPDYVFSAKFNPASAPGDIAIVCRMGAPDETHCVIFRIEKKAGGIFALHDSGEILLAAIARDNLAFLMGKSFFGEIIANSRSGIDIFEQTEEEDD